MRLRRTLRSICMILILVFVMPVHKTYAEYMYKDEDGNIHWGHDSGGNNHQGNDGQNEDNPDNTPENEGESEQPDNGEGTHEGGDTGGDGGTSGTGEGEDDDPEINQLQEEVDRLQAEYDRLYQQMGEESRKHGNTGDGISEELKEDYAAKRKELNDAKKSLEDKREEKKRKKEEEKNLENAELGGDPVRLTNGSYEQNETDITISGVQGFDVKRKYDSKNTINGSFGYGWSTNLDQRIIPGVEASALETYEKFTAILNEQAQLLAEIERNIISGFQVSSLETENRKSGEL